MITEDYVSFETAKLLKEKGFDENISVNYFVGDDKPRRCVIGEIIYHKMVGNDTHLIACPTLQMAMKWLREEYNCHICVQALITTFGLQGYCPFYAKIGGAFMWQNALGDDYATAPTYEEACEAAIKYCLENLI